jgi:hypothetical protein
LRGVSWIHLNLQGALIAAPELSHDILHPDKDGIISVHFTDVSQAQLCPPQLANLVSIYVRFSGPELVRFFSLLFHQIYISLLTHVLSPVIIDFINLYINFP